MLKRLHLRNFTVFADAEFKFGEGLNVLVGTNGTGKTHVLKAGYVVETAYAGATRTEEPGNKKISLVLATSSRLGEVFQSEGQNNLIRRSRVSTEIEGSQTQVIAYFGLSLDEYNFIIEQRKKNSLKIVRVPAIIHPAKKPVFIPAKEVLTTGWLSALYNRREIPIDKTYPDLLHLLFGPPLRQPEPAHIVEKLAQLIGGKVEEEGGHFYLAAPDQPRLEMNLVAEGMRKFATLYKLLANGTLTPETTLFWDEPEANLNPALLKEMAVVLTELAQVGFQIILATHSLFLMRELHILAQQKKKSVCYFGLYAGVEGDVQVETTDDFMQLQHITALDAELTQTFDFEAALDQDYAGDN